MKIYLKPKSAEQREKWGLKISLKVITALWHEIDVSEYARCNVKITLVSLLLLWGHVIVKKLQDYNMVLVLFDYSPSDTKIRNLDELKNYIGSDGTCKCGLSCPLRLEVAFSFDPKVSFFTVKMCYV